MITTKQINVNLAKEKLKLRHVTTKGIDAGVQVEPPKAPIKPRGVTTTTLADVADIAEKKRRDDIAAEQKFAMKDEKKIVINEKGEANKGFAKGDAVCQKEPEIITAPAIVKDEEDTPIRLDEIGSPAIEIDKEKKPWKEMTDAEKSEEVKRRAVKAKATRAKKKKERQRKNK